MDKCVFACHINSTNSDHPFSHHDTIIAALALVHVGDIMFIGDDNRLVLFKKCMREFDHGEYEQLGPDSPLKFCRITVAVSSGRKLTSSQEEFYSKLRPLDVTDFIVNKTLILERAVIIRRFKSLAGCLIWVMSTRFGFYFRSNTTSIALT